jgi:hypothetical protein
MGPAYFVIAIMGCSDTGLECRTVATAPVHYGSEQACLAARGNALMANSDLEFPTLFAHCLPRTPKATATEPEPAPVGALAA